MFSVKTNIHEFETFELFANQFQLGKDDLVITQSFIYEPYIKPLGLPCTFVMQERYGAGEPSDEMIQHMMDDLADCRYNRVVAVGGGTVIDISKLFALGLLSNVTDAFERRIPIVKLKQLVIVPTTCGTGSEVTNISIAELKSRHTKLGLADSAILADDAVLVPELLRTLPFAPFAFSAIDALIHATESYLSPKANAYTRLFSVEAMRLILPVFKGIAAEGPDYRLAHLGAMLRASNYAGIAFGNAGCGAVHALSYPLGGTYHVAHGESNYQFFTHILGLYAQKNPDGSIADLNAQYASLIGCPADPSALYPALDRVLSCMVKKRPLHEYGMKAEECASFTDSVLATQQRLLANNYVPLSREDIEAVYKALY
ncbi:MAG: 4-hydroxybutyrate dehydrogenase [Bacteroidales bacterium]|nr:4-hydroxybutyrate dehydrogenase [Bacteroidales bacterium]